MELYLLAVRLEDSCSTHQVSAFLDWLNLAQHCSDFFQIQTTSAWRRSQRPRFQRLTSRNRTLSVRRWKEKASWLMFCSESTFATSVGWKLNHAKSKFCRLGFRCLFLGHLLRPFSVGYIKGYKRCSVLLITLQGVRELGLEDAIPHHIRVA